MNSDKNFSLIEGLFTAEEAKEILLNIFSAKIQFHQLKNFSSIERFGRKDEASCHRIPVLKDNIATILEILKQANDPKKVKISAEITIKIVE